MLAPARLCGKEYTTMRIFRTILVLACLSSFAFAGDEEAVLVKLNNGRAEVYTVSGSYMRTLGSGDVTAVQLSGDTVALTRANGRVEVYGIDGSYKRTL